MRDLNDLHFFVSVVKEGGFSAAARALGVAKSRVSKRIAVLEDQLGVRLIERSTRRFSVTDVGKDVYARASAVVEQANEIEGIAARLKAEPQGLVRASCPPNAMEALERVLPALLERYPLLRVQLVVTNRRIDLINERIDVAIRVRDQFDTDGDLQLKIIGTARLLLVASPRFLATVPRPADPADLKGLSTIAQNEMLGPTRWTLSGPEGRKETIELDPRLAAGDFAILLTAAFDGLGIGLLPESLCAPALEGGQLERVLPDWSASVGTVHLVFTSQRGMLPSVRAFIDCAALALGASLPRATA
ncbi:MAG: LysR family transcriptional regulator [Bradyrhizobium sp.]|nr:LysR family transcriptional regulator [Bradyrhizobium sp.]